MRLIDPRSVTQAIRRIVLVHLLVVDRAAFDGALPSERVFQHNGEWMTAAWSESGKLYLLAAQGDRETIELLL
jgi:hypothetical protein